DLAVFAEVTHGAAHFWRSSLLAMGPVGGRNVPETGGSIKSESGPAAASRQAFTWVVGPLVAPLAHQFLELGVAALGQHDPHGGEEIAGRALGGEALALEPEGAARVGAGRDRELDRAVKRWHPHLAAEHGLVERHRQFQPQVSTIALEQR